MIAKKLKENLKLRIKKLYDGWDFIFNNLKIEWSIWKWAFLKCTEIILILNGLIFISDLAFFERYFEFITNKFLKLINDPHKIKSYYFLFFGCFVNNLIVLHIITLRKPCWSEYLRIAFNYFYRDDQKAFNYFDVIYLISFHYLIGELSY